MPFFFSIVFEDNRIGIRRPLCLQRYVIRTHFERNCVSALRVVRIYIVSAAPAAERIAAPHGNRVEAYRYAIALVVAGAVNRDTAVAAVRVVAYGMRLLLLPNRIQRCAPIKATRDFCALFIFSRCCRRARCPAQEGITLVRRLYAAQRYALSCINALAGGCARTAVGVIGQINRALCLPYGIERDALCSVRNLRYRQIQYRLLILIGRSSCILVLRPAKEVVMLPRERVCIQLNRLIVLDFLRFIVRHSVTCKVRLIGNGVGVCLPVSVQCYAAFQSNGTFCFTHTFCINMSTIRCFPALEGIALLGRSRCKLYNSLTITRRLHRRRTATVSTAVCIIIQILYRCIAPNSVQLYCIPVRLAQVHDLLPVQILRCTCSTNSRRFRSCPAQEFSVSSFLACKRVRFQRDTLAVLDTALCFSLCFFDFILRVNELNAIRSRLPNCFQDVVCDHVQNHSTVCVGGVALVIVFPMPERIPGFFHFQVSDCCTRTRLYLLR